MSLSRSLRALDWLNFFVADIQTGFGPFVTSYLASYKWTQGEIGLVLSIGTITAMIGQIPSGAIVDEIRNKHVAVIIALISITISAIMLATSSMPLIVLCAEVLHGFASCVLEPSIAAISLTLVHFNEIGARLGRNARWASIGSALAAIAMGTCAEYFSVNSVFWLTAVLILPSLISLWLIENLSVIKSTNKLCENQKIELFSCQKKPKYKIIHLLSDRRTLTFTACIVLFHLANAAMLNLAAGEVTIKMNNNVQLIIAICIIIPQIIVAIFSPWVGRTSQSIGRRPILLIGLLALPLRAILFANIYNPYLLIPIQLLDGVSASVFGVMVPLIAADIVGNKGRYNLCLGFFGLAAGIGATLSTTIAGFTADYCSLSVSFYGLAIVGVMAIILVWWLMPETYNNIDTNKIYK